MTFSIPTSAFAASRHRACLFAGPATRSMSNGPRCRRGPPIPMIAPWIAAPAGGHL